MLAPKKLKRRKLHRPNPAVTATTNISMAYGQFGLKAMGRGWITAQQIESARRVMTRYTKKGGKIWIRIFPHHPITQKGSQSVMGGGKGVPEYYVACVSAGTIMFEMGGITLEQATEALNLAGYKLPVKTKFIVKE